MKLRQLFEKTVQQTLPGVQQGKIEMTAQPKKYWDWADYARDSYNNNGLKGLFDYISKTMGGNPEEYQKDFDSDRGEFKISSLPNVFIVNK